MGNDFNRRTEHMKKKLFGIFYVQIEKFHDYAKRWIDRNDRSSMYKKGNIILKLKLAAFMLACNISNGYYINILYKKEMTHCLISFAIAL